MTLRGLFRDETGVALAEERAVLVLGALDAVGVGHAVAEGELLVGALGDGDALSKGVVLVELLLDKAVVTVALVAGDKVDAVRVEDVLAGVVSEFLALVDVKAVGGVVAVGVTFVAETLEEGLGILGLAGAGLLGDTGARVGAAGVRGDDTDGTGGGGKDLRVIGAVVEEVVDDVGAVFSGAKLRGHAVLDGELFLGVARDDFVSWLSVDVGVWQIQLSVSQKPDFRRNDDLLFLLLFLLLVVLLGLVGVRHDNDVISILGDVGVVVVLGVR